MEAEIQAVVLRALADSDFGGKQQARASINVPSIPIRWPKPGETLGLWPWDKPPIFPGNGDMEPLTVKDHTLIMRAIMEHPLPVLRYLPAKYKSKTGARPSGNEVLQAALKVDQIDDYVKERIRAVLDILPKIEEAQADAPESLKRAVDGLRQQLADKTVAEQRSVLRDSGLRRRYREVGGLDEGMEVAARILEDGQDSIYSPDNSFYYLLQQGSSRAAGRDAISDIGSMDTIGATAGGAVGSVAVGVGAGPGAVAGGVGASAGAAIAHIGIAIWDAIFD